jgi:hypothetical protein
MAGPRQRQSFEELRALLSSGPGGLPEPAFVLELLPFTPKGELLRAAALARRMRQLDEPASAALMLGVASLLSEEDRQTMFSYLQLDDQVVRAALMMSLAVAGYPPGGMLRAVGWSQALGRLGQVVEQALGMSWRRSLGAQVQLRTLMTGLPASQQEKLSALLDAWAPWSSTRKAMGRRGKLRKQLSALSLRERGQLALELMDVLEEMAGKPRIAETPLSGPELRPGPIHVTETPESPLLKHLALFGPRHTRSGQAGKKPPERHVNMGFARKSAPAEELLTSEPLACGGESLFWVEIGKRLAASIQQGDDTLPDELPEEAVLQVVLFTFENELRVRGEDIGELQLGPGGSRVTRPVAQPAGVDNPARLFFRVAAPKAPGTYRLRCNLYYEKNLLQSYLVTAEVRAQPRELRDALSARRDYTLSGQLDPALLQEYPANRVSFMLNGDESTHSLHAFGGDGSQDFKSTAMLNPQRLGEHVKLVRGALAKACYGQEGAWSPTSGAGYRYETFPGPETLTQDLRLLAIRGYRLYSDMVTPLVGGKKQRMALEKLLLTPGRLQLALKESVEYIFPAALVYDYHFDTNARAHSLCPAFSEALLKPQVLLEQTPCFQGGCPSRGEETVICPSGFWGFRHPLGIPLSVGDGETPPRISYAGGVKLLGCLSTDPAFTEREKHLKALSGLKPMNEARWMRSRKDTLSALKQESPHIVYFYCHGGMTPTGIPFLSVGDEKTEGAITRDNLTNVFSSAGWEPPSQPLVFLNGCHTTALTPEGVMNLAGGFVVEGNAAGVVGSEVTLFEPLAGPFAEECLRRFLAGTELGQAVHGARLALLARGNPLGLAYVPFAVPGLRLVPEA